jgi:OFA family oxalate/formate antiporter-like MFS transporter
MACVANLQYGWTWFVNPINEKFHWGKDKIQYAFTLFILIETWLIPVEAYLVDKFGPKWVVLAGSILVTISWALNSIADSLALLYVAAAIGGIGVGCVYGTCVGNALKWFPGRRGLAAGITASGYGAGAAFSVPPIRHMIETSGYQSAFMNFALIQGAIVFVLCWFLLVPPASTMAVAKPKASQSLVSYSPAQVLSTPVFYVLYIMFVLIAAGGLSMTASVGPLAEDFKVAKTPVEFLFWSGAAATVVGTLNRVFDGIGRPLFGFISDHIGREYTMAIAFFIGAAALFTLSQWGSSPMVFVLVMATYFGVYGEIFSLFPATQGDTFGAKFAAANAGILYTAKGAGSLLVPFAAVMAKEHGWSTVFSIFVTCNCIAGLMALFVLKPMRAKHLARSREAYTEGNEAPART